MYLHTFLHNHFLFVEKSYWTPYLNTLPTAADTHFPVFWSEEELNELQNSRIKPHIIDYRSRIERKYEGLSKHIFPQWKDIFTPSVFSYENYLWATAIMDSRGIWWGNGRHLVPLLDLINCNEEGPDPKRVHATRLDASGVNAVTLADRDYHTGDQIFENYGQPNWIYLTYHGTVSPEVQPPPPPPAITSTSALIELVGVKVPDDLNV